MVFDKGAKTTQWWKASFNKWGLGKLNIHLHKTKWDPPYTTYKDELRRELRAKTIKLLEEDTRKSFMALYWQWFLRHNTKSSGNKRKKNRCWATSNSKTVCLKGYDHQNERQGMGREKTCKSRLWEGVNTWNEELQLNCIKANSWLKKWGKDLHSMSLKEMNKWPRGLWNSAQPH